MFTGSGPIKETFKYSMETQFEANADTKIGSAAVEHLHLNKSVLSLRTDWCQPEQNGVIHGLRLLIVGHVFSRFVGLCLVDNGP